MIFESIGDIPRHRLLHIQQGRIRPKSLRRRDLRNRPVQRYPQVYWAPFQNARLVVPYGVSAALQVFVHTVSARYVHGVLDVWCNV